MNADLKQLVQAREAAEAVELAARLDRLQAQAGSSMVISFLILVYEALPLRHC